MGLVEKPSPPCKTVHSFQFRKRYGVKEEPQVTEESLGTYFRYNKTKMISERVLLSYKDRIAVQIVRPATICGYSPRMRLDLSVNMLTVQALANGKITVFGGDQTRPNIHIQDITDVFIHFLTLGDKTMGIYNAGSKTYPFSILPKWQRNLFPPRSSSVNRTTPFLPPQCG